MGSRSLAGPLHCQDIMFLSQTLRSVTGPGKMVYYFQNGRDAGGKKMNHMQFISGGWLEGSKEWGLVWKKTRVNSVPEPTVKCTAVKFKSTTGKLLTAWKCRNPN